MGPNPEYANLDLKISSGEDHVCQVEIIHSGFGENETPVAVHLDPQAEPLKIWLAGWQNGTISQPDLIAMGQFLMQRMLPAGTVRNIFENARGGSDGLRIRLRLSDSNLQALPWEFVYDAQAGDFMTLDPHISLVRYLERSGRAREDSHSAQMKILALVSLIPGTPDLQGVAEVQNLIHVLQDLLDQEFVRVDFLVGSSSPVRQEIESFLRDKKGVRLLTGVSSLTRLQEVLRDNYWILHYIGHGNFDVGTGGYILLSTEDGAGDEVDALTFSRHLRNTSLEIAVLNACRTAVQGQAAEFKGIAQRLVQSGLPAVVAMQAPITDFNAVAFSRAMFGALARQYSLDAAVTEGRVAVAATRLGIPGEFAIPVLFLRSEKSITWQKESEPRSESASGQPTQASAGFVVQGNSEVIGPVVTGTVQGNVNYSYQDRRGMDQPGDQDSLAISQKGENQADLEVQRLFESMLAEYSHLPAPLRIRYRANLEVLQRAFSPQTVNSDVSEIILAATWLLDNAPGLKNDLTALFHNPKINDFMRRAGSAASAWMEASFYQP